MESFRGSLKNTLTHHEHYEMRSCQGSNPGIHRYFLHPPSRDIHALATNRLHCLLKRSNTSRLPET
jgi:hypothetical protein